MARLIRRTVTKKRQQGSTLESVTVHVEANALVVEAVLSPKNRKGRNCPKTNKQKG